MSEFVYLSTFNQFDWDCFAGALPLPDKSGPFIGEVSDWTVIVSGTEAGTACVQLIKDDAVWNLNLPTGRNAYALVEMALRQGADFDAPRFFIDFSFDKIN